MTNGRSVAILSYLTIIGWAVALYINNNEKTKLGSYHIRQSLMLWIVAFLSSMLGPLGWVVGVISFVYVIIGIVDAANERMRPVPLVGEYAQKLFKSL